MLGINDKLFQKYIKNLLELDWSNYRLYIVGGILEGWNTNDIDIFIESKYKNNLELFYLMARASQLGPFDFWYTGEDIVDRSQKQNLNYTILAGKHYDRKLFNAAQREGYWHDHLFWSEWTFPLDKHIENNRIYTKPPMLIVDGNK